MNEPQHAASVGQTETTSSIPKRGFGILPARIPITIDTILSLRLAMDANISPDGKRAAFVVWEYVADEQKRRRRIWVVDTTGGEPRPLTTGPHDSTNPRWSPDSQHLAYVSRADGEGKKSKPQLHVISAQGGEARQVCKMPNGVSDPAWAPDGPSSSPGRGCRIAFLSLEGEEPKTDPLVITPDRHRRLWTVRPDNDIPEAVTPDGYTVWDYAWSQDSRQLAVYFTTGPDETDWYRGQIGIVAASGGAIRQVTQLTQQAGAFAWSPGGKRLAYISGEWSDQGLVGGDIFVLDLATGETRNLTEGAKFTASWCQWLPDGQRLLYACWSGVTDQIGILDAATGAITVLADDFVLGDPPQPHLSATPDGKCFVGIHSTQEHSPDIFFGEISGDSIAWRRLSRLNPIAEETLALAPTERIRYASVDGWYIDALFTHPLTAKGNTPPPLIVHVHGGPSWAYTDGFAPFEQLLAAAGYAVLRPNIRGSQGRGVAFSDAVIGDMGGKDFQDVLNGVEYLVRRGLVDGNRVGITGGSYGGFMTAWAVTQTNRFKAAVMAAGVSDFHSFHAQSNIYDWDVRFIGASPLEQPDMYRARSAITFANQVVTPTLIVHGEQDQAVPVSQAFAFYRALRERSVPTELVLYPREGHNIAERNHFRDYLERTLGWFEKYL